MGTEMEIKTMNPPNGKALVYIMRSQFKGKGSKMKLKINGFHFATTKGKKFVYIILDPGTYLFESICENKSELKLNIETNKKYFISQVVHQGTWKPRTSLKLIDEEKAHEKLEKCSLIELPSMNTIPTFSQYESQVAMVVSSEDTKGEYNLVGGVVLCLLGGLLSIFIGFFLFDIYPEFREFLGIIGIILQYLLIIGGIITFIGLPVVFFNPEIGKKICLIGGLLSGILVITILGASSIRKKVE